MLKLETKLDGVTFKHAFNVAKDKAAKAAKDFKRVFVTFDFTGLTIADVIEIALRPLAIIVQNLIRADYTSYSDGQQLTIVVNDLGKKGPTIPPEQAVRNKYAAADTVEQKAQLLHDSTGIPIKDCLSIVKDRLVHDQTN
ncbi:hypothetical protein LCGC14_0600780 [marine sediment metagenome]|uniref:Uncharacterized protein n=1 Tax=marine sediment metagenome TaxID=412755 RepID=A0A0F9RUK6_9ZZZZ